MSKIFIDFEYTREHQKTTPISLGIVTEDGNQQFYAEFTDFDQAQVDAWLQKYVFSNLLLRDKPENYVNQTENLTEMKGTIPFVMKSHAGLYNWLEQLSAPSLVMASFGLFYDGMLFKELFKIAQVAPPQKLKHFCYDVSTLFQEAGEDPDQAGAKERFAEIDEVSQKHNALFDAHVARRIYRKIKGR